MPTAASTSASPPNDRQERVMKRGGHERLDAELAEGADVRTGCSRSIACTAAADRFTSARRVAEGAEDAAVEDAE